MIRFRDVDYYDSKGLVFFKFDLDNQKIIGQSNLEQNKKIIYNQLAKFYKLKGYTKYNKDDLIQFIVDNKGYEYSVSDITQSMSDLVIDINPYEELKTKLLCASNIYEKNNLRNCYAYRCWLWNTYGLTYEQEMDRAFSCIK